MRDLIGEAYEAARWHAQNPEALTVQVPGTAGDYVVAAKVARLLLQEQYPAETLGKVLWIGRAGEFVLEVAIERLPDFQVGRDSFAGIDPSKVTGTR